MQRLLKDNPGETFLIEGHTDAVGAEVANLALSDERAEAVATAFTNVFAIPPENMETQGYGEQYPTVDTQEPEREQALNRAPGDAHLASRLRAKTQTLHRWRPQREIAKWSFALIVQR